MRALLAALLVLAAPAAQGPLKPFGRGSWQAIRQAHAGRPAIVHFWGISCAPCLTELPKWGQLSREKRDVDLIFVDADPVAEGPAKIAAAMTRAGIASSENWVFADRFLERLWFEVDPNWAGEMPFTVFVSRTDDAKSTSGAADFATVRAWIDAQKPQ